LFYAFADVNKRRNKTTLERFEEIFDNTESDHKRQSKIFKGLEIIRKYLPDADIEAAEHDIIYAADVDELIEAGITEDDVKELAKLTWHIDEDALAHFA
jgi:hypothetical protein